MVLFGCGAAVLAGEHVGQLGIAFAFGLAIVAMACGIGPVSGCHVNPAVSFGAFVAGRMDAKTMLTCWVAQFIGATIGAGILYLIATGKAGFDIAVNGPGQNGWGEGYLGEYTLAAAIVFEIVATFIFLVVILGSIHVAAPTAIAGLSIGLTLTAMHIVGIQVTGVSVNLAPSFGPALFAGGEAVSQLWRFLVAPLVVAGLAGMAGRMGLFDKDAA
jgi:aquaporin Z